MSLKGRGQSEVQMAFGTFQGLYYWAKYLVWEQDNGHLDLLHGQYGAAFLGLGK